MSLEPTPPPEPPALFDIEALEPPVDTTAQTGGLVQLAPAWLSPLDSVMANRNGADFEWLPWGLLWPVHDLTFPADEVLVDAPFDAGAAIGQPATEPAAVTPEPPLDLPVLWAFGGFERGPLTATPVEAVAPVEAVGPVEAVAPVEAAPATVDLALLGPLDPPVFDAPAAPVVRARPGVTPAGRLRSGLVLLVVVVSMATLLAAVVGVVVAVIVLALQSALG